VLATITCVIRLIILCAIGRYLAATVPFLFVILYLVQAFYLRTSRQVRLLDIEAKAPLYTHFTETIQGISSIHAFAWGSAFQSKSQELLNQSQKPIYMLFCIQQWLTLVLDLVVGGIAVILIAIIVTWKDSFSAVQVGVALNLLLSFNSSIAQAIKMWTMMEMSIGAVTRVQQFVKDTPVEEQDSRLANPLPGEWPSHGAIQFHNLVAGYRYGFSFPSQTFSIPR
jgi:ATP-binding cassette subfamily C (CFTR/MRP) protein 1